MPVFEYHALNEKGGDVKGIIDADSVSQARSKLRSYGTFPVSIKETNVSTPASLKDYWSFVNRIKANELTVMTRQLATLVGAGIPLVQALSSLVDQTGNKILKKVIAQIKDEVNQGGTLTKALQNYPKYFSTIFVNMVRAGEVSGSLEVVLEKLADFSERQSVLRGKLQAALIYPCFMAIIGVGILFILLTYVVPNITQVFEEMDKILPLPTRILISFSENLRNHWLIILICFVMIAILGRFLVNVKKGRFILDKIKLKMPIIGQLTQKILLSRFASTLSSLLESGVGLLPAMQIVRALLNNVHVANVIDNAIVNIQKGKSMTAALSNSEWFPPIFTQMISVGEQSGKLEGMLQKIALTYEREVEAAVAGLTALIEPLMIVCMGIVVGCIVLSILLPIFEMNQMI